MKKKKDNNDNNTHTREIPELQDVKIALTGVINIDFTAEEFFDYYDAIGWTFGNKVIRNWRALLRKWIRNPKKKKLTASIKAETYYLEKAEEENAEENRRLAEQKANAVSYEAYLKMKKEGKV